MRRKQQIEPVFDRTPPHSIEAERSVLGACLLNSNSEAALLALDVLQGAGVECFYIQAHRIIWGAIVAVLKGSAPLDYVTLMAELTKQGQMENIGGASYLAELAGCVPVTSSIENYARIVLDAWQRRELIACATRWAHFGYGAADENDTILDTSEILSRVDRDVLRITMTKNDSTVRVIGDIVPDVCDRLHSIGGGTYKSKGLMTGFTGIDNILDGFLPGQSIVIAARPSVGKTAFALNIAARVARERRVLFISLEMAQHELVNRIVQSEGQIEKKKLREQFYRPLTLQEKLNTAYDRVSGLKLRIMDTPTITGRGILNLVRKEKIKHGVDLVIIDYLQLVDSGQAKSKDSKNDRVSEISRLIKLTAKECQCPVISLSQLSRDGEDKPKLTHLRDSGSIEQDADIVILLSRKEKEFGSILADIAKQRDGEIGCVPLRFNVFTQTFSDYDASDFDKKEQAPASVSTGDFFDQQDAAKDPYGS